MAFFKKLTKKVVADVKETVKEETAKTTDEIKEDIKATLKENWPVILAAAAGLILFGVVKKPTVTVKVIVKQVSA